MESDALRQIFIQRLKDTRERKGLSQGELAQLTGLKPAAVSHFETGIRLPSFENLRRLADALAITIDYLVGRTDAPSLSGPTAEMLFRSFSRMTPVDQRVLADMALALAARHQIARGEIPWPEEIEQCARKTLADAGIAALPVDPFKVARHFKIDLQPFDNLPGASHGYILRTGDAFRIGYSQALNNKGQINVTVAHELGHYFLPEHLAQLCPTDGALHCCVPETGGTMLENQADHFAADLLLPRDWFVKAMEGVPDNLDGIKKMADDCQASLTATAGRFARCHPGPAGIIVSRGGKIVYGFLSDDMRRLVPDRNVRYQKGRTLPEGSVSRQFNEDENNVVGCRDERGDTRLSKWFPGNPVDREGVEEVVGLGRYGRSLTLLRFNP